jgi:hypothetical protein
MMRPALRSGVLVFAMCLMGYGQAEAGLWDLIEALDGPGPSSGNGNIMVNLICSDTGANPAAAFKTRLLHNTLRIPESASGGACLFYDFRSFKADEDERFFPVDIDVTEFGPSLRLHAAFEVGAGIGWLSFKSRFPGATSDLEGTKLTVSFPRLVFKPLMAIPFRPFKGNPGWGFFQMYFRETIVVGNVADEDFASKPGTEFSRDDQRVSSMGFIIDVTSVLRLARVR